MAAACIILDSDGDDEVDCGSCEVPTTPARDVSRTGDAVPFVDLCSDVEENDCDDLLVDAAPENSGRNSTSECEVHRGSLWDSDDEELAPLSARLQPRQASSRCWSNPSRWPGQTGWSRRQRIFFTSKRAVSPPKRKMVHRISDSEDEDGLPDLGHVIGTCVGAGGNARPLTMNGQPAPAVPAADTVTHASAASVVQVDEETVAAPAYTQLKAKRVRITPEEREARRAAKELEKQRKAVATEMGRATKPGHCMKASVVLDSRLLDDEASLQRLCETLEQAEIRAEVQVLPVERAVCWRRTALSLSEDDCLLSREQVEERDVMVVLPWDQFLHLVASQRQAARTQTSLSEHMMSINDVYQNRQLTYVVYGLEKYFKQQKSRANAEYRALILGSQQAVRRRKPGVYDGVPLSRKDIQEVSQGHN
ncbi:hypothetical protein HPB49_015593 [Dermacentor silvarum]|uniref:Uncharacterized protein n=1 Tax=Dermacentor silvarum TaxID=543639 RepID=A0ACB8CS15_DERSI|nr:hypothetical protein HPB49_015593 [Dermacentor silvarum]